jgi:hypothetical protein
VLVDDLLDYLTSGGAGTKGTDLFGGPYPDSPATVSGILETGGFESLKVFGAGAGQSSMERPRVQIMTRSTEYDACRKRSQQVANLLDGLQTRTINGVTYHWAQAVSPPAYVGSDENGCHLFSLNVDILRDRMATS